VAFNRFDFDTSIPGVQRRISEAQVPSRHRGCLSLRVHATPDIVWFRRWNRPPRATHVPGRRFRSLPMPKHRTTESTWQRTR